MRRSLAGMLRRAPWVVAVLFLVVLGIPSPSQLGGPPTPPVLTGAVRGEIGELFDAEERILEALAVIERDYGADGERCAARDRLLALRAEVLALAAQGDLAPPVAEELLVRIDVLIAFVNCTSPVPFETLWKGYLSYYRYGDGTFRGGCLAIRENATWVAFWEVHTWGSWPEPPAPEVDFARDMVLGCILGFVPDCCASDVNITAVDGSEGTYRVSVRRHTATAMLHMVTNPFHLVVVPRTDGEVRFLDLVPWGPEIPQIPPVP